MEKNYTDIHHARAKGCEIDYWLTIDKIDAELSGLPLKYRSDEDVSSALGVNPNMIHDTLYRLRTYFRRVNESA